MSEDCSVRTFLACLLAFPGYALFGELVEKQVKRLFAWFRAAPQRESARILRRWQKQAERERAACVPRARVVKR